MLGTHVRAVLLSQGFTNLLYPSKTELDLLKREAVEEYFSHTKPEYVFHLAGLVYGLGGNLQNQTDALYTNAQINLNVLRAAGRTRPKKIFFAGTVASYPYPFKSLPLTEDQLFLGEPHAGEYGYAVAKNLGYQFLEILRRECGIEYCVGLFTNLFGEYDTFNSESAHVVPSLVYKFFEAAQAKTTLEVWGDGSATRDFMYAKDAARAAVLLMERATGLLNVSTGEETTIKQLVMELATIADVPLARILWRSDKPTGIERRSVDNGKLLALGFNDFTHVRDGLRKTYEWYKKTRQPEK